MLLRHVITVCLLLCALASISGCGARQTTSTAASATSLPPTAPVVPSVTPLPPTAPVVPSETPLPPSQVSTTTAPAVKPRVELSATPQTIGVSETLRLTVEVSNIGIPKYTLQIDGAPLFTALYSGQVERGRSSQIFEVIEVKPEMGHMEVVLRGLAAGRAKVSVEANGEIQEGSAYYWGVASSDAIELTVHG